MSVDRDPNSLQPVLALLSQGNVVLDVSRDYFATIHTWLPMVSKKRIDVGLPVQNAGPDLAMLFLGMKLVTAHANDIAGGGLYSTAKDFITRLESNGAVSLLCLQAMVLVALYEYSHAIYPAAWMTIGSCARYAEILGFTLGDYSVLGQAVRSTSLCSSSSRAPLLYVCECGLFSARYLGAGKMQTNDH